MLDLDAAGPGGAAHDGIAARGESEGVPADGGGGEADDHVPRAGGGFGRGGGRFLRWEKLIGDEGGDFGISF